MEVRKGIPSHAPRQPPLPPPQSPLLLPPQLPPPPRPPLHHIQTKVSLAHWFEILWSSSSHPVYGHMPGNSTRIITCCPSRLIIGFVTKCRLVTTTELGPTSGLVIHLTKLTASKVCLHLHAASQYVAQHVLWM